MTFPNAMSRGVQLAISRSWSNILWFDHVLSWLYSPWSCWQVRIASD